MTLYIAINCKVRAFNYGRMWLWHVLSLVAVLWLGFVTTLDIYTSQTFLYIIIMICGWAALMICGFLVQQKCFPSLLRFQRHPNLVGLYMWALCPTGKVKQDNSWFRSQNIYDRRVDDASSIVHHSVVSDERTNFRMNSFDSQGNIDPMSSEYLRGS